MHARIRWIGITIPVLLICALSVHAQDVEDNVSKYSSKNGKMYLQPLADIFGANLNSGLFHSARIPKMGFHLYIGVKGMMAPVSEEQKTFIPVSEGEFDPPAGTELPTVFGSEEEVHLEGMDEPLPGGVWDTDWVPLAVPQLTVGSLLGTEVTIRWFEIKLDEKIGKIQMMGWGVRHSLSQYIPLMPVDIAVGYFRQKFEVGDLVDACCTYFGVQASYQLSVLCLYGGVGLESSGLDIRYTFEENGETSEISFELDGANRTRFTAGVALDIPGLKIHVDANFSSQTVYSAGIGFGF